jgi:hypothetical protein
MAAGEVAGARQALLRLAGAVVEAVPEGTVRGSGTTRSVLFSLERVRRTPTSWRRRRCGAWRRTQKACGRAGVAGYPEHGGDAGEVVAAAFKAAKRVGGSSIVVTR